MEALLQDLRYAMRMVAKSPGTTAIALLTIGIATGANATVFGFVSALLLRPAPGVTDPGSLVSVYTSDYSSGPYGSSSYPDYLSLKSEVTAFTQTAAQQDDSSGVVQVAARVERVPEASVTGDYFPLLGVLPAMGRLLTPADAEASAPPVVVVSHSFWRRILAADPTIVGTPLTSNGRTYTVVGVLQEGFGGLDLGQPIDVWMPLVAPATTADARGDRSLAVVARLREGLSLGEAQTQVSALAARLALAYPETNRGTLAAPNEPRPMIGLRHSRLPPDFRPMVAAVSAVLMAAVGLVLVIACANVAGLLVSRAIARDREMAVRRALGAGRTRVVRMLLTESLVLGIGGGICGLLLALWTSDVLPSFFPAEQAELLDTSVDVRTVGFIAAISIASSLLFGLAPALHASGATASLALRAGAARGFRRPRWRQASPSPRGRPSCRRRRSPCLVRTARQEPHERARRRPRIRHARGRYRHGGANDARRNRGRALLLDRARAGTDHARRARRGLCAHLAAQPRGPAPVSHRRLRRQAGRRHGARHKRRLRRVLRDACRSRCAQGGHSTLAIGRAARRSPSSMTCWPTGSSPAMPSARKSPTRAAARWKSWGLFSRTSTSTVQEPPVATVYYPLEQAYLPRMTLAARIDRTPRAMVEPIARAIAAVDPRVPVYRAMLLSAHLEESTAADRLTTSLVALCGGMALLLATIGVYGVIAYAVVRRAREIGIRIALGARPPDVVRLILGEGLRVTGFGVALGLVAAALTARALGSLMPLYGVGSTDPLTYAAVPVLLLVVALLAALPPTRRALRLDPNVVLRQE